MPDLNQLVEEYIEHERNLNDFEDSRFGEIYLDDKQGELYDE